MTTRVEEMIWDRLIIAAAWISVHWKTSYVVARAAIRGSIRDWREGFYGEDQHAGD